MRWIEAKLRTRAGRVTAGVLAVVVLLPAIGLIVWSVFGPERFAEDLDLGTESTADLPADPAAPLALSESTRVYLVYSVGSKGMSDAEAERLRIRDADSRGADGLTDTMMLLFVDPPTRKAALLSIPRDTWLFDRGHRINATYNLHGLQAFVDDVAELVGVPIHHVVEVNFAGFGQLVNDIGGVALRVEAPLADLYSALYVPRAGCWRFDGADALAFVRSRHTLTLRGERWVVAGSASDVGRMGRQRQLLAAAWEQLRGPGLVTEIPALLSAAQRGLRFDDGLGVRQLVDLARTFSDIGAGGIEAYTLPTTGQRISGAAAQVVVEDAALPILRRLRAWPPGRPAAEVSPSPATPASPSSAPQSQPPPKEAPPDPPSSPAASPDAGGAPASPEPSPSPSPVPDPEIETLGPDDSPCTPSVAVALPAPDAGLLAILRQRGGDTGRSGGTGTGTGTDGGDPSPGPGTTGGDPSPAPTGDPSDEPSEEPSPEPSPDPTPGPTISLPPLPG